jgi:hypothetical protein
MNRKNAFTVFMIVLVVILIVAAVTQYLAEVNCIEGIKSVSLFGYSCQ